MRLLPLIVGQAVLTALVWRSIGRYADALDIVHTNRWSSVYENFFDFHLRSTDTLAARSVFGVGRTCALHDEGRSLFCWVTAGVVAASETAADPTILLALADLKGLPGPPSRFIQVAVARDVWVLTDTGSVVVLMNAGSGGQYGMRMPHWPPSAAVFGAPAGNWSIGVISPPTPYVRVYVRPWGALVRSACGLRADGEAQCFSIEVQEAGGAANKTYSWPPGSALQNSNPTGGGSEGLPWWDLSAHIMGRRPRASPGRDANSLYCTPYLRNDGCTLSSGGPWTTLAFAPTPDPDPCVSGVHPWATNSPPAFLALCGAASGYTFSDDKDTLSTYNTEGLFNAAFNNPGSEVTMLGASSHDPGLAPIVWRGRETYQRYAGADEYNWPARPLPLTISTRVMIASLGTGPVRSNWVTPVRWYPPSAPSSAHRYYSRVMSPSALSTLAIYTPSAVEDTANLIYSDAYLSTKGIAVVPAADGVFCWLALDTGVARCSQLIGARQGPALSIIDKLSSPDIPEAYASVWRYDLSFNAADRYLSLSGGDYSLCALRALDMLPECYVTPSVASIGGVPEHVGRAPSAFPLIPGFPLYVLSMAGTIADDVVCIHMRSSRETLNRASALAARSSNMTAVTRCYGRQGAAQTSLNGDPSMPAGVSPYGNWSLTPGYGDICQVFSNATAAQPRCWGEVATVSSLAPPTAIRSAAAGRVFICGVSTAKATPGEANCSSLPGSASTAAFIARNVAPLQTVNVTSTALVNSTDAFGNVTRVNVTTITATIVKMPVSDLCAGQQFACALLVGTRYLSCAGVGPDMAEMALAAADSALRPSVSNGTAGSWFTVDTAFSQLSCGSTFVCAREAATGWVRCIGSVAADAAGATGPPAATAVANGSVCTGWEHGCAITEGSLAPVCWGPANSAAVAFQTAFAGARFSNLACTRTSTCGATTTGQVLCSGDDRSLRASNSSAASQRYWQIPAPDFFYALANTTSSYTIYVDQAAVPDDGACSGAAESVCFSLQAAVRASAGIMRTIIVRGRAAVTGPLAIPAISPRLTIRGIPRSAAEPAQLVFLPPANQMAGSLPYDLVSISADAFTLSDFKLSGGPAIAESNLTQALLCSSVIATTRRFTALQNLVFRQLACSREIVRGVADLPQAWTTAAYALPDVILSTVDFDGLAVRSAPYPAPITSAAGPSTVFSCAGLFSSVGYASVRIENAIGSVSWPAAAIPSLPCAARTGRVSTLLAFAVSRYFQDCALWFKGVEVIAAVPPTAVATGSVYGASLLRGVGITGVSMEDVTASNFVLPAADDDALATGLRLDACIPAGDGFNATCSAGISLAGVLAGSMLRIRTRNMRSLGLAHGRGGAVAIAMSTTIASSQFPPALSLAAGRFEDSSAAGDGGALYIQLGGVGGGWWQAGCQAPVVRLTVTDTTFTAATSVGGRGGALAVTRGTAQTDGAVFTLGPGLVVSNASAALHGGGFFLDGHPAGVIGPSGSCSGVPVSTTVTGATFTNTRAGGAGGAIAQWVPPVPSPSQPIDWVVTGVQVVNSSALGGDGGALAIGTGSGATANRISSFTASQLSCAQTATVGRGGCLFVQAVTVRLSGDISDASASGDGGGICAWSFATLDMSVLSLASVRSNGSGGAIAAYQAASAGAVTLTNAVIANSSAAVHGGAVYISALGAAGTASLNNVSVVNATAGDRGGAMLFAVMAAVTVANTTTVNTVASGAGGSIYTGSVASVSLLSTSISHSTVTSAARRCASILAQSSNTFAVADSIVKPTLSLARRQASKGGWLGGGGAVYSSAAATTPTMTWVAVGLATSDTTAEWGGSVAVVTEGTGLDATLANSTIVDTAALCGDGGGVYVTADNLAVRLSRTYFRNATALAADGGALFAWVPQAVTALALPTTSTVTLDHNVVRACRARNGGGIALGKDPSATLASIYLSADTDLLQGCAASVAGGAMHARTAGLTLRAPILLDNAAEGRHGGALFIFQSSLVVQGGVWLRNVAAASSGGAIGAVECSSSGIAVGATWIDANTPHPPLLKSLPALYGQWRPLGQAVFGGNAAAAYGGALYAEACRTSVLSSIFHGNLAVGAGGGAVAVRSAITSDVAVQKSVFLGNTALGAAGGGALYISRPGVGVDIGYAGAAGGSTSVPPEDVNGATATELAAATAYLAAVAAGAATGGVINGDAAAVLRLYATPSLALSPQAEAAILSPVSPVAVNATAMMLRTLANAAGEPASNDILGAYPLPLPTSEMLATAQALLPAEPVPAWLPPALVSSAQAAVLQPSAVWVYACSAREMPVPGVGAAPTPTAYPTLSPTASRTASPVVSVSPSRLAAASSSVTATATSLPGPSSSPAPLPQYLPFSGITPLALPGAPAALLPVHYMCYPYALNGSAYQSTPGAPASGACVVALLQRYATRIFYNVSVTDSARGATLNSTLLLNCSIAGRAVDQDFPSQGLAGVDGAMPPSGALYADSTMYAAGDATVSAHMVATHGISSQAPAPLGAQLTAFLPWRITAAPGDAALDAGARAAGCEPASTLPIPAGYDMASGMCRCSSGAFAACVAPCFRGLLRMLPWRNTRGWTGVQAQRRYNATGSGVDPAAVDTARDSATAVALDAWVGNVLATAGSAGLAFDAAAGVGLRGISNLFIRNAALSSGGGDVRISQASTRRTVTASHNLHLRSVALFGGSVDAVDVTALSIAGSTFVGTSAVEPAAALAPALGWRAADHRAVAVGVNIPGYSTGYYSQYTGSGAGGALHLRRIGSVTISNTSFVATTARLGGAIYLERRLNAAFSDVGWLMQRGVPIDSLLLQGVLSVNASAWQHGNDVFLFAGPPPLEWTDPALVANASAAVAASTAAGLLGAAGKPLAADTRAAAVSAASVAVVSTGFPLAVAPPGSLVLDGGCTQAAVTGSRIVLGALPPTLPLPQPPDALTALGLAARPAGSIDPLPSVLSLWSSLGAQPAACAALASGPRRVAFTYPWSIDATSSLQPAWPSLVSPAVDAARTAVLTYHIWSGRAGGLLDYPDIPQGLADMAGALEVAANASAFAAGVPGASSPDEAANNVTALISRQLFVELAAGVQITESPVVQLQLLDVAGALAVSDNTTACSISGVRLVARQFGAGAAAGSLPVLGPASGVYSAANGIVRVVPFGTSMAPGSLAWMLVQCTTEEGYALPQVGMFLRTGMVNLVWTVETVARQPHALVPSTSSQPRPLLVPISVSFESGAHSVLTPPDGAACTLAVATNLNPDAPIPPTVVAGTGAATFKGGVASFYPALRMSSGASATLRATCLWPATGDRVSTDLELNVTAVDLSVRWLSQPVLPCDAFKPPAAPGGGAGAFSNVSAVDACIAAGVLPQWAYAHSVCTNLSAPQIAQAALCTSSNLIDCAAIANATARSGFLSPTLLAAGASRLTLDRAALQQSLALPGAVDMLAAALAGNTTLPGDGSAARFLSLPSSQYDVASAGFIAGLAAVASPAASMGNNTAAAAACAAGNLSALLFAITGGIVTSLDGLGALTLPEALPSPSEVSQMQPMLPPPRLALIATHNGSAFLLGDVAVQCSLSVDQTYTAASLSSTDRTGLLAERYGAAAVADGSAFNHTLPAVAFDTALIGSYVAQAATRGILTFSKVGLRNTPSGTLVPLKATCSYVTGEVLETSVLLARVSRPHVDLVVPPPASALASGLESGALVPLYPPPAVAVTADRWGVAAVSGAGANGTAVSTAAAGASGSGVPVTGFSVQCSVSAELAGQLVNVSAAAAGDASASAAQASAADAALAAYTGSVAVAPGGARFPATATAFRVSVVGGLSTSTNPSTGRASFPRLGLYAPQGAVVGVFISCLWPTGESIASAASLVAMAPLRLRWLTLPNASQLPSSTGSFTPMLPAPALQLEAAFPASAFSGVTAALADDPSQALPLYVPLASAANGTAAAAAAVGGTSAAAVAWQPLRNYSQQCQVQRDGAYTAAPGRVGSDSVRLLSELTTTMRAADATAQFPAAAVSGPWGAYFRLQFSCAWLTGERIAAVTPEMRMVTPVMLWGAPGGPAGAAASGAAANATADAVAAAAAQRTDLPPFWVLYNTEVPRIAVQLAFTANDTAPLAVPDASGYLVRADDPLAAAAFGAAATAERAAVLAAQFRTDWASVGASASDFDCSLTAAAVPDGASVLVQGTVSGQSAAPGTGVASFAAITLLPQAGLIDPEVAGGPGRPLRLRLQAACDIRGVRALASPIHSTATMQRLRVAWLQPPPAAALPSAFTAPVPFESTVAIAVLNETGGILASETGSACNLVIDAASNETRCPPDALGTGVSAVSLIGLIPSSPRSTTREGVAAMPPLSINSPLGCRVAIQAVCNRARGGYIQPVSWVLSVDRFKVEWLQAPPHYHLWKTPVPVAAQVTAFSPDPDNNWEPSGSTRAPSGLHCQLATVNASTGVGTDANVEVVASGSGGVTVNGTVAFSLGLTGQYLIPAALRVSCDVADVSAHSDPVYVEIEPVQPYFTQLPPGRWLPTKDQAKTALDPPPRLLLKRARTGVPVDARGAKCYPGVSPSNGSVIADAKTGGYFLSLPADDSGGRNESFFFRLATTTEIGLPSVYVSSAFGSHLDLTVSCDREQGDKTLLVSSPLAIAAVDMEWLCRPPDAVSPQTSFNVAIRLADEELVPLFAPAGRLAVGAEVPVCPSLIDALTGNATAAALAADNSANDPPAAALVAAADLPFLRALQRWPTNDTVSLDNVTACTLTLSGSVAIVNAQASARMGVVVFSGAAITAPPGSTVSGWASCSLGSQAFPRRLAFSILMNPCMAGFAPSSPQSPTCARCPSSQYSLGGFGVQSCTGCPRQGVTCYGGLLVLLPSFYRVPAQSLKAAATITAETELFPCITPTSCTVNVTSTDLAEGATHWCNADDGYTGPLCGLCREGFAKTGLTCQACPPRALSLFLVSLLPLAFGGFAVWISLFRKTGPKEDSSSTVIFKTLVVYVGVLGTLGSTFVARGTEMFRRIFQLSDAVGGSIFSVSPVQCTIKISYYLRFTSTVGLPFIMAAAAIFINLVAIVVLQVKHTCRRYRVRWVSVADARLNRRNFELVYGGGEAIVVGGAGTGRGKEGPAGSEATGISTSDRDAASAALDAAPHKTGPSTARALARLSAVAGQPKPDADAGAALAAHHTAAQEPAGAQQGSAASGARLRNGVVRPMACGLWLERVERVPERFRRRGQPAIEPQHGQLQKSQSPHTAVTVRGSTAGAGEQPTRNPLAARKAAPTARAGFSPAPLRGSADAAAATGVSGPARARTIPRLSLSVGRSLRNLVTGGALAGSGPRAGGLLAAVASAAGVRSPFGSGSAAARAAEGSRRPLSRAVPDIANPMRPTRRQVERQFYFDGDAEPVVAGTRVVEASEATPGGVSTRALPLTGEKASGAAGVNAARPTFAAARSPVRTLARQTSGTALGATASSASPAAAPPLLEQGAAAANPSAMTAQEAAARMTLYNRRGAGASKRPLLSKAAAGSAAALSPDGASEAAVEACVHPGGVPVLMYGAGRNFLPLSIALRRMAANIGSNLLAYFREQTWVSPLLFVMTVGYSSITSSALNMFNCLPYTMAGITYHNQDLAVECYTPEHTLFRIIAGVVIAAFVMAIPVLIFILLSRNAKLLRSDAIQSRYGFLLVGYAIDRPVPVSSWESIIMLRRALVVCIGALVRDPFYQSFAGLGLFCLALFLQASYQPYERTLFNVLETLSVAGIIVTQLISLFYLRWQTILAKCDGEPDDTIATIDGSTCGELLVRKASSDVGTTIVLVLVNFGLLFALGFFLIRSSLPAAVATVRQLWGSAQSTLQGAGLMWPQLHG